jgi:hypothetical protein
MDVRKYFDSVDHEVLKELLRRRISDKRLLAYLFMIIDSYRTVPGRGIPIGNLTSQYFANHILATLDHYAKDNMKAHYWIRYMDDIVAFSDNKLFLDELYEQSVAYTREKLSLTIKPKIIDLCQRGIPFLGYLIRPSGIFLARRSKKRFIKAIKKLDHQLNGNRISQNEASCRAVSITAATTLARSRAFRQNVLYGSVLGYVPGQTGR